MVSLISGNIDDMCHTEDNILLFRVKLSGDLKFRAGQYVKLTLDTVVLREAQRSRFLSIASTAREKRNLTFAVSMTDSEFKRHIISSGYGEGVRVEGPRGRFFLHENPETPAVFITDKIGVAPARGIVEDATLRGLHHRIHIFHHEMSAERNILYNDIVEYGRKNRNVMASAIVQPANEIAINCTETCGGVKDALGEDFMDAVFYLSGIPINVVSMRNSLLDIGISPERIRMQSFAGY